MENKLIEVSPLEAIRLISGMFNPKEAVNRLAVVNLLSRYLLGMAEKDFVEETMMKMGVKLIDVPPQELN